MILDRRLVTDARTEYIRKIAVFCKEHPIELGNARTALVVSELASYGMGRMAQALLDNPGLLRIFTEIEDARWWLCS